MRATHNKANSGSRKKKKNLSLLFTRKWGISTVRETLESEDALREKRITLQTLMTGSSNQSPQYVEQSSCAREHAPVSSFPGQDCRPKHKSLKLHHRAQAGSKTFVKSHSCSHSQLLARAPPMFPRREVLLKTNPCKGLHGAAC